MGDFPLHENMRRINPDIIVDKAAGCHSKICGDIFWQKMKREYVIPNDSR